MTAPQVVAVIVVGFLMVTFVTSTAVLKISSSMYHSLNQTPTPVTISIRNGWLNSSILQITNQSDKPLTGTWVEVVTVDGSATRRQSIGTMTPRQTYEPIADVVMRTGDVVTVGSNEWADAKFAPLN